MYPNMAIINKEAENENENEGEDTGAEEGKRRGAKQSTGAISTRELPATIFISLPRIIISHSFVV